MVNPEANVSDKANNPKLPSIEKVGRDTPQHTASGSPDCEHSAIEGAIEASRSMLDLKADWDDSGARTIDISTWSRATTLLRDIAIDVGDVLPTPHISPCADGSIDLYWNTGEFTLLINVKPEGASAASDYYGERQDGTTPIRGVVSDALGMTVRQLVRK